MLHMLAEKREQGLLGSPFKHIKTSSDAAHLQSISPPMHRTGIKLSVWSLCILLPWRYTNTIQPFCGEQSKPGMK